MKWTAATDNVGVDKYNLYVNNQLLETVAAEETAITLKDLAENTAYTVTVKAVDAAGNESVTKSISNIYNWWYTEVHRY